MCEVTSHRLPICNHDTVTVLYCPSCSPALTTFRYQRSQGINVLPPSPCTLPGAAMFRGWGQEPTSCEACDMWLHLEGRTSFGTLMAEYPIPAVEAPIVPKKNKKVVEVASSSDEWSDSDSDISLWDKPKAIVKKEKKDKKSKKGEKKSKGKTVKHQANCSKAAKELLTDLTKTTLASEQ